jgi:hypothetical protein
MSKARRLAISGAALTALLALVAVASRAHRPGGGSGAPPAHAPALLIHYVVAVMLVLFPFGTVLVIWALAQRRKEAVLEGNRSLLRSLVTIAVLLGIIAFRVIVYPHIHVAGLHSGHNGTGGGSSPFVGKPGRPSTAGDDWLALYVVGSILVGFLVVIAAAVITRRRSGAEWDAEAELAAALDSVLKDTLADLRDEHDPRRAVIRTYARMEETFAAYGVGRHPAETSREYVERVLERLQVSSFAVDRLTRLYARAKFSTHEIDAGMKEEAIEALAGLRSELAHTEEAA